ncbi:Protein DCL, chloroplastic isoform B [Glycine soja]|uniref:Protein DCL, chloroplastic isoform B n=1 Tax=Glycine soja TaxID=3848 RepID=A0A445KV97_GLYSO|nr:Protein DCL, chloroplastic isoform B [Glycine soja]
MMMISTSTMALASLLPKTAPHVLSLTNPSASTPFILPFSFHCLPHPPLLSALKASSSGGDDLRGKPLLSQGIGKGILEEHAFEDDDDDKWVDWEDQILEDTVPLVGFVRMILHSGQYDNGDRLSAEHEKTIIEKLLPFHPEFEKKIGSGVDYITVSLSLPLSLTLSHTQYFSPDGEQSEETDCWSDSYGCNLHANGDVVAGLKVAKNSVSFLVRFFGSRSVNIFILTPWVLPSRIGYHPDFERSRCLFIVREDGELVDFSYWKCIKGLIRKNYPLYADSFILRHFRKKSRNL